MFGYIKPNTPELKVRESEEYNAVYCSLCKALGKHYGVVSRLTLSYDCTFLALVILGAKQECTGYERGRCMVNPLKKCTYCVDTVETMRLPAALSVISMYHKLLDDLHDSDFLGKLRSILLMPLALRPYRRACKDYPKLGKIMARMMREQAEAERDHPDSLDICAEPTAKMLSQVFVMSTEDPMRQRVLENLGYFLGKWIYLIDAADDLEDDLKSGSFNPLAVKGKLPADADPKMIQEAKDYCNGVLNMCAAQILSGFYLLELGHYQPIIGNILEQGLPEMQKKRLFETKEKIK